MNLLNCSENDIIEVLFQKGVLPSKDFKLVCTQKELTIALKRLRSSNDFLERFGSELRKLESTLVLVKPTYGQPNTNLSQALEYLFTFHPLYRHHLRSLDVKTELMNGGKGRLPGAIPNNKRKYAPNQKDTSSLPKKMFKISNVSEEQKTMEQIMDEQDHQIQHDYEIKSDILDNDCSNNNQCHQVPSQCKANVNTAQEQQRKSASARTKTRKGHSLYCYATCFARIVYSTRTHSNRFFVRKTRQRIVSADGVLVYKSQPNEIVNEIQASLQQ
jgi:hypothetical protein